MRHRLVSPGAERFLPFAESCVAKLLKLGLPYADQSFEVDGVSIKVRIEPGHEHIRIDGGRIAMESGAILIGFRSLYSLYTIDSSKLYRPTYTAAQYAVDKRQTPKKPAPRDSDVYCRPKPPDVMDENPFVYNGPYDSPDGGGPLSAKLLELYEKKTALIGTLASRYSGKTRLFVQAILGSNPLRLENKAGESWLDGCYLLGKSTAIFADRHGIYWMIRVGGTDAVRMRFSAEGEAIRARLASTTSPVPTAERGREETYMFSTMEVLKPNFGVSDISAGIHLGETVVFDEPNPNEFTLAYSWHFSRDTGKGIQVKHKISAIPGTPLHLPLFESQVYTLQFHGGQKKGDAPSIVVSEGGYSMWSKEADIALIGQVGGINYAWYPRQQGDRLTCNAPMYAFYDANDDEVIIHFKRTASAVVVADPWPGYDNVAGTGTQTITSHSHQEQFILEVYATRQGSVSTNHSCVGQSGIVDTENTYTVVGGGPTVSGAATTYVFGGAYAVPNGMAGAPYDAGNTKTFDVVGGYDSETWSTSTSDKSAGVFIMVSTTDPDCVYVGSRSSESKATETQRFIRWVGIHATYYDYLTGALLWEFDTYNNMSFGIKNGPAVYDPVVNTTTYDSITVIKCITAHHMHDVLRETLSVPRDIPDEWAYVFGPDDAFSRSYMVIESYNGAAHIMSKVSPFEMDLLDGAVEDANLFIGYA